MHAIKKKISTPYCVEKEIPISIMRFLSGCFETSLYHSISLVIFLFAKIRRCPPLLQGSPSFEN